MFLFVHGVPCSVFEMVCHSRPIFAHFFSFWSLFTIKVHTARMNTRRQLLDRQAISDDRSKEHDLAAVSLNWFDRNGGMDPYFHTFHSWDDHPLNICLPGLLKIYNFFLA